MQIFLLAAVTMITVKISFSHFHSSSCQGNIFLHQIMQPISPNYNWENGVKKKRIIEENLSQSCILCHLLRTKTQGQNGPTFFKEFLPLFPIYLLSGCDLFNMSCLSQISMMASLDILCSNPLNLKNKITKIEHKKIFCGPSKNLKNISWSINICLKYFMTLTKTLRPPSYILIVSKKVLYIREIIILNSKISFI